MQELHNAGEAHCSPASEPSGISSCINPPHSLPMGTSLVASAARRQSSAQCQHLPYWKHASPGHHLGGTNTARSHQHDHISTIT